MNVQNTQGMFLLHTGITKTHINYLVVLLFTIVLCHVIHTIKHKHFETWLWSNKTRHTWPNGLTAVHRKSVLFTNKVTFQPDITELTSFILWCTSYQVRKTGQVHTKKLSVVRESNPGPSSCNPRVITTANTRIRHLKWQWLYLCSFLTLWTLKSPITLLNVVRK